MTENRKTGNNSNLDFDTDQIQVSYIFNFLFRNRQIIGLVALIFFIIASLLSLTKKRVWEGEFQIVLNTKNSTNFNLGIDSTLEKLGGLSGPSTDLKTEVGILESPSVLMPIFDFINSQKKLKKEKIYPDFSEWKKNNLNIALQKGTSILDVSYRDIDQDLIIPFLNKLSDTYQGYSNRSKKRKLEFTRDFLKKQILLFKQKSSKSLKVAQEFAIDQDLMLVIEGGLTNNKGVLTNNKIKTSDRSNESFPISNIEIENVRVQLTNKIKKIDLQLKKIDEMINDKDQIKYISSTVPALVEEGLPEMLRSLEQEISKQKLVFTDKDKSLITLKKEKEAMIDFILERTIGLLNAEKLDAKVQLEAAKRPKGVLLKYKELIREAIRDENTLINLENQLIIVELDMSRIEDPWQLITEPTLLSNPVAPSRRKYAMFGLIIGILGGAIFGFYKEKKSGCIYEKQDLEEIMKTKIISIKSNNNFDCLLLEEKIKSSQIKNIKLLNLNQTKNRDIKFIQKFLTNLNINAEFSEDNQISYEDENKLIFLVTNLDNLKINDAMNLNKILNFYKIKLKGIILFN